jgi:hypothetical protein
MKAKRGYRGENRVFWITIFNIKAIKENGFQTFERQQLKEIFYKN